MVHDRKASQILQKMDDDMIEILWCGYDLDSKSPNNEYDFTSASCTTLRLPAWQPFCVIHVPGIVSCDPFAYRPGSRVIPKRTWLTFSHPTPSLSTPSRSLLWQVVAASTGLKCHLRGVRCCLDLLIHVIHRTSNLLVTPMANGVVWCRPRFNHTNGIDHHRSRRACAFIAVTPVVRNPSLTHCCLVRVLVLLLLLLENDHGFQGQPVLFDSASTFYRFAAVSQQAASPRPPPLVAFASRPEYSGTVWFLSWQG